MPSLGCALGLSSLMQWCLAVNFIPTMPKLQQFRSAVRGRRASGFAAARSLTREKIDRSCERHIRRNRSHQLFQSHEM
jgi:hypothetical protein